MKWITHQAGAVVGALALAMPAAAIGGALAGAVFPDILDQKISGFAGPGRQKLFNKIHRGASHWAGWWLALFPCAAALPFSPLLRDALAGFAFGAMTHVLLDMLTMRGVPLLPFSRRHNLSFQLCSTGQSGEYIFLAALLAAASCLLLQTLLQKPII